MSKPHSVTVYEVGPRDGFQNLARFVPTDTKVDFIDALSATGLPAIEATSFVSPKWVPQLADAREVMERIKRPEGVRFPVLVPNSFGLERALAAGVEEVAVFTAASESFNRRNINASVAESIERFRPVAERVRERQGRLRGYVSTAFGCPYQGDVDADAVVRLTASLFQLGCAEVSIGDTIGIADPEQVGRMVELLGAQFDLSAIALHLHDTYGRGLANVLAGLDAGISVFDAAAGGLGGCPYAAGASGNLATEDLVSMLHRLGIETGVDLPALVEASSRLADATRLQLPSRALAALRMPRRRVPVPA
ncbi:MAG TPA: hydroxymethylglutaryl-CoA lyase [Acidobacteriota bacterium]|nr:hydroxymethylglutaryl-CoA lyase [Acidobacteriota bacterium]